MDKFHNINNEKSEKIKNETFKLLYNNLIHEISVEFKNNKIFIETHKDFLL